MKWTIYYLSKTFLTISHHYETYLVAYQSQCLNMQLQELPEVLKIRDTKQTVRCRLVSCNFEMPRLLLKNKSFQSYKIDKKCCNVIFFKIFFLQFSSLFHAYQQIWVKHNSTAKSTLMEQTDHERWTSRWRTHNIRGFAPNLCRRSFR